MDWFSWLSRTNLEPCLVHEYGLSFSNNELEREDISYFNHEFLQSMGISIAKHRLEILKLARRDLKNSPHRLLATRSISKAVTLIKNTSKSFSHHIRSLIRREEEEESSRALVLVSEKRSSKGKWRSGFLKRKKRSHVMPSNGNGGIEKQERLLLTYGTPCRVDCFKKEEEEHCEEIKWDSMFTLKPT